jgi:hypothetical protein
MNGIFYEVQALLDANADELPWNESSEIAREIYSAIIDIHGVKNNLVFSKHLESILTQTESVSLVKSVMALAKESYDSGYKAAAEWR